MVCCVTSGLNLNVTVLIGDCRFFRVRLQLSVSVTPVTKFRSRERDRETAVPDDSHHTICAGSQARLQLPVYLLTTFNVFGITHDICESGRIPILSGCFRKS